MLRLGFRCLGFGVRGFEFRVSGLGLGVQGLWFRVWVSGIGSRLGRLLVFGCMWH